MGRITRLLTRWRSGRERIEEGEEAREIAALDDEGPDLDALDGDDIRIKTPSTEHAEELVDVLRKHGVACDLKRPHSSEVEVAKPDDVPSGETMRATVRGVELWLLLENSPDEIEVRCGKETVLVSKPAARAEPGPSTTEAAPPR